MVKKNTDVWFVTCSYVGTIGLVWGYTMTFKDIQILKKWIEAYKLAFYRVECQYYPIAKNITPKQLEKFEITNIKKVIKTIYHKIKLPQDYYHQHERDCRGKYNSPFDRATWSIDELLFNFWWRTIVEFKTDIKTKLFNDIKKLNQLYYDFQNHECQANPPCVNPDYWTEEFVFSNFIFEQIEWKDEEDDVNFMKDAVAPYLK